MRTNVLSKLIIGCVFAGLSSFVSATPEPTALMATPQAVEDACRSMPGITCVMQGATMDVSQLKAGLPMSKGEYFLFDQSDMPSVRGFLVLSPRKSAAGNTYYEAVAKIFKTGFAGIGMTSTNLYDSVFWRTVADMGIPFSPASSPRVKDYLEKLDASIKERDDLAISRALAKQEADEKAKARAAYLASPEFASEQKQRQIDACKQTIIRSRQAIAQDDRVAKISGYQNKLLREQAAVAIVRCEDFLAQSR